MHRQASHKPELVDFVRLFLCAYLLHEFEYKVGKRIVQRSCVTINFVSLGKLIIKGKKKGLKS